MWETGKQRLKKGVERIQTIGRVMGGRILVGKEVGKRWKSKEGGGRRSTYNSDPSGRPLKGMKIWSKNWVRTRIPSSVALLIRPSITSCLKGRKTISRNSTIISHQLHIQPSQAREVDVPLTLTRPVPCPMSPSDAESRSYRQIQRPIFWMTLFAYLALILSSIAWLASLLKSSGWIWTRSAILVCSLVRHSNLKMISL